LTDLVTCNECCPLILDPPPVSKIDLLFSDFPVEYRPEDFLPQNLAENFDPINDPGPPCLAELLVPSPNCTAIHYSSPAITADPLFLESIEEIILGDRVVNSRLFLSFDSKGPTPITTPGILYQGHKKDWQLVVKRHTTLVVITDSLFRLATDYPSNWKIHVFSHMLLANAYTVLQSFHPNRHLKHIAVTVG